MFLSPLLDEFDAVVFQREFSILGPATHNGELFRLQWRGTRRCLDHIFVSYIRFGTSSMLCEDQDYKGFLS
jgi:hypothetical protein